MGEHGDVLAKTSSTMLETGIPRMLILHPQVQSSQYRKVKHPPPNSTAKTQRSGAMRRMLRMGDAQDAKNSNSREKRTHNEHTKNHDQ